MKKFLLMLAMMLPCLGAWAQTPTPVFTYENITAPQELSTEDATTIRNMTEITFVADVEITNSSTEALLFSAVADYTSSNTDNNSIWGLGLGGNQMRYIVGPRTGGWYSRGSVTTSATQLAYTYDGTKIKMYVDGVLQGEQNAAALNAFSGENAKFYLGGVKYNTNTNWGTFNGTISSVKIYDSAFTDAQITKMFYPGAVITTEDFVNGKVYTFKTSLGWMGAKADGDNAISTAKTSNNATGSAEDPYYQWTVYKSDKGNFYIYNVGKEMFLGEQSTTGNASVPMSITPAKVTFKATTKSGYPLMFKTTDNESCVINHSTEFGEGLITWNGGWSNTNNNGNSHLILMIDDLDANVFATIKSTIDAYEADNTEAVAELDATITKAQTLFDQITIGTGIGEYTVTNANYIDDFNAIVAFRQAIQATNNPTPEAVKAKTAKLEELIASFSLNMPEAGKFYRINNGGNYITSNVTSGNRIALSADYDNAASVYYYDGAHLLAFNTGLYMGLNDTDWTFEAVGSNNISAIEFVAAANGAVAKYNIKSGGRWLHKDNGFVNRCQNNTCGDSHNWTITEVTWLPIPVNVEAGWTTLYSPVELALSFNRFKAYTATSIEDNSVVLEEQTVVPANVGVVLKLQEGAQVQNGCVFLEIKATETEATSLLEGTYADTYVAKDAYVLSRQMIEEEYVVGLFKATKNQQGNTSFLNNGFKAYLPTTQGASMQVLRFNFGGTTGIEDAIVAPSFDANAPIYDLSGRRVVNAVKGGLYIQNGKKFIVK